MSSERLKEYLDSISDEISNGTINISSLESLSNKLNKLNKEKKNEKKKKISSDDEQALYERLSEYFELSSKCKALESELNASAPPLEDLEKQNLELKQEINELQKASEQAKKIEERKA